MKIYRKILHEHPLPIARVYERATNGEEGKDLHDRSLLVFEVFVHWLGILAIGAARARCSLETGKAPLDALGGLPRSRLDRPSRGIWLELMRSLAGKGPGFLSALGDFLSNSQPDPDIEELLKGISETLGAGAQRGSKVARERVLGLLVQYRNRTVGHGASLEPEAYARLSVPLFNGIGALLKEADFLLGFPAFWCEELRYRPDGSVSPKILRLMGNVPVREPLAAPQAALGPGALFVLPVEEGSRWFGLSSLALYREKSLYLYNGGGQDGTPRYLCFDDNSQIAEGKREDVFPELAEAPSGAASGPSPSPRPRLRIVPERVRAGETFLLRIEVPGGPEGQPLQARVRADSRRRALQLGPTSIHGQMGKDPVPLSFHFTAVQPGSIRLEVEVSLGRERIEEGLEITVLPGTSLPFVGRAKSTERLSRWLDREGCGLFLLRGEPGVGKSRLAQEAAFESAGRGAIVLFGKGRKSFRFPLQPFREVLVGLLHQVDSEMEQTGIFDFIRSSLRHSMPEEVYIADYFKAFLARGSISQEQKAMVPYFWVQLFQRFSEGRPVLAVMDDLQWAEVETIQLLAEVLGLAHQRGVPLKVLAIVQPFGSGPEEEKTLALLGAKMGDLEADRIRVETLDLRPMEESELDSLLDVSFPGNSFRRDMPWIYGSLRLKTGGNPLFAEWILKGLRSDVELRDPSLAPETSLTPEWFEAFVPREIEFVLDKRLGGLDAGAKEAVEVAAAIGDPFDLRLLEKLLGGVEAMDAALPVLEKQELVAPTQDPIFFRFTHSLISQKVYRDFIEGSRWKTARLHARIADAMSSIYCCEELARHALVYAHHLVVGNRREEGLKFLVLGAGRLLDGQLYAAAVPHLELARSLVTGGVAIEGSHRALLYFRLGETYRVLGRIDEALEALQSAGQEEKGAAGSLKARIQFARGSIHVLRGELDAAEEIFRSILSLELPESPLQVAGAVSGLATVQRTRGRLRDALQEHLRALDLREKAEAEIEVAISCVNVGNAHFDLGEHEAAERAYRRSLPIFEARGFKNYLIYALSGLGNVFFKKNSPQAMKHYEKALRLCQETGNRAQLGVLHYNLGEIALKEHRYSEAAQEFQRALGIMVAVSRRSGEAGARCRKAELHRILGELDAAGAEVALALEIAKVTGSKLDLAAAHIEGARIACERGEASRAREEVEEALRSLSGEVEAPLRLSSAQILLAGGDVERARQVIEEAAAGPGLEADPEAACLLEHLRGLSSPDPGEALAHLERALELSREEDWDFPRILSDLASRVAGDRSRELHSRAVQALKRRSRGIEDEAARRKYLLENHCHREIISRAQGAGVAVDLS